jgi:hypothetical protein
MAANERARCRESCFQDLPILGVRDQDGHFGGLGQMQVDRSRVALDGDHPYPKPSQLDAEGQPHLSQSDNHHVVAGTNPAHARRHRRGRR